MLDVRLPGRQEPYASRVDSGSVEAFWAEAEKVGLQVMAYGPGSRLQVIGEAARRHPGLPVAIDHLSMSPSHLRVDVSNIDVSNKEQAPRREVGAPDGRGPGP